ncbi:MAG: sulfurtransferase TusA family protein [Planctomycetes bacterium]|nr:sulfurtransferase TusA family protein [Planctomycetota bacterium]MBM4079174.1 sulfurtransferase TusA family protein [Planctomycetota bacterium]MBM4084905.1 sulfurtransferase TusA family protein [Planctomycetota bacterium]
MPEQIVAKETLDLRGEKCPMNYVRTKLKIEQMGDGEVLEVILKGAEAMRNVPRSLKEDGHKIVDVKSEGDLFRLKVKKGG